MKNIKTFITTIVTMAIAMQMQAQVSLVQDIRSGSMGSNPTNITNVSGTLFFNADDGINGAELWKSDGTTFGTGLVKDIRSGSSASSPGLLTNVNGTLFFRADNGTNGSELWKSDGTVGGTALVKDIRIGNTSSGPTKLTNVNGTLFFSANDGIYGEELWKSDGTAAGTVIVKDITSGFGGSVPNELVNVNGTLFFTTNDFSGTALWKSDGTAAGTVIVSNGGGNPTYLINVNGTLFFTAIGSPGGGGTYGVELWKIDGTTAGTEMVKDININGSSYPNDLTNVNGTLFFSAYEPTSGFELWKSDGTEAGTVLVKDIYTGGGSSFSGSWQANPININGILFFNANDGINGVELWKSDGTVAGTVMVKDIYSGSNGSWSSSTFPPANVNGRLFFNANNGTNGVELWESDGTVPGTVMVMDINPGGLNHSYPRYLTNLNGTLFFGAAFNLNGHELWKTDNPISSTSIISFTPTIGPIGTEVEIEGTLLDGATDVKFNGVSTSDFTFQVLGGVTSIVAVVPVGATTGTISVTTPNGSAISASNFTIPSGPGSILISTPINVAGGSYDNVTIANGGTATFTGGINVIGDIIVMNGGIAYFQDVTLLGQAIVRPGGYASLKQSCHILSGSGSFELKEGATLEICDADGISTLPNTGNIQVTGGMTFSPKANYVYNGDVAQVTGDALPSLVNDLTINNAAGVTLSQNTTVNGVVYVKTLSDFITDGKLTLASGASLMHGTGTPGSNEGIISNDNITVKRTGHSSPLKWNFWGAPVTGANTTILGSRPNYYNPLNATNPNTTAGLQTGWVPYSGVMTQGVGYISKGGGTVSFTGTVDDLNSGTPISVPVTKNANGVIFNVLGNPFPSAIDATAFVSANAGVIAGSLYFWDDDGTGGGGYTQSDFAVWSGAGGVGPNSGTSFNGNISSGQGFSVACTTPGNVIFTNDMRTTTNNVFFRQAPIERLWVSVTNPVGLYNEVLVAFMDDATDGYDTRYDAKKFRGNDNIALYTKLGGEDFAIQALAPLATDKTVALGFDAGIAGSHTLQLKTIENMDETVTVILEDTETGAFQNLRLNDTYTFTAAAGKHENRFLLHFNPAMQIETGDATCAGGDAAITIRQEGSKHWNYTLKDSGGLMLERRTGFNGTGRFQKMQSGIYTLTLADDYGYQVVKLIELKGKSLVAADFEISSQPVGVNEEVSFVNLSDGATIYEWNFGDGSPIVTDENPVYDYSLPGTYEVSLTALNDDCSALKSGSVQVEALETGVSSTSGENTFRVYTTDKNIYGVFDFGKEQLAQLVIYDVLGRTIYKQQVTTSGVKIIAAGHLSTGCLLIKLNTENEIFTQKIFIGR